MRVVGCRSLGKRFRVSTHPHLQYFSNSYSRFMFALFTIFFESLTQSSIMAFLTLLPFDIVDSIIKYLHISDIAALSATCRQLSFPQRRLIILDSSRSRRALRWAARKSNMDLMIACYKIYRKRRIWTEEVYNDGHSNILLLAIWNNNVQGVRFLLQNGFRTDSSINDLTALHCAIIIPNNEIVQLLVSKGAQIDKRTTGGLTPTAMALKEKNYGALNILLQNGADANGSYLGRDSLIVFAVSTHNVRAYEILLSAGADVVKGFCESIFGHY